MIRFLEILLKVILSIVLIGFTLTTVSLAVNEPEIALFLIEITCYITLPLLLIAVAIDVKYN